MENEKKVSLTINHSNYQRLSDYCKRYGVSQRHMIHLILDDAIDNDRYKCIFGRRHRMSHLDDKVAPKKDVDDYKVINDLTVDTSISESDDIIDKLKKDFDKNDDDFDFLLENHK
jgi:hypothetical protein